MIFFTIFWICPIIMFWSPDFPNVWVILFRLELCACVDASILLILYTFLCWILWSFVLLSVPEIWVTIISEGIFQYFCPWLSGTCMFLSQSVLLLWFSREYVLNKDFCLTSPASVLYRIISLLESSQVVWHLYLSYWNCKFHHNVCLNVILYWHVFFLTEIWYCFCVVPLRSLDNNHISGEIPDAFQLLSSLMRLYGFSLVQLAFPLFFNSWFGHDDYITVQGSVR